MESLVKEHAHYIIFRSCTAIRMKISKVAIVIVNYNGWRDTIECLESLRECSYPAFSIYIVDNASGDESVQKLIELRITNHELQIIQNGVNSGFAGGNNVGIKKALEDGAEYVLLLNNDTIVPPDFLTKLAEVAESDALIGVVGPKIYFADTTTNNQRQTTNNPPLNSPLVKGGYGGVERIWFGGGKLNWLRTRGTHIDLDKVDNPYELSAKSYKLEDADYITGCCLLIKREVIDKIGLMPEDYFLYYEDVDWCLKAKHAGYRVVYVPAAHIWHKVSRSTRAGSASYVQYHVRNGLMLAWRFGNLLQRMVLAGFMVWTAAKQLIKLFMPSKKEWAKAVLRGYQDFLAGRTGKSAN